MPGKLATLVPKEVVRRPPRSQVTSSQTAAAMHGVLCLTRDLQAECMFAEGFSLALARVQAGPGEAAAAGPMTSASVLQLASVVDKLCSFPLVSVLHMHVCLSGN